MISAIDRKLLRDLWRIKGQGLAIACVIGSGISMFVMYRSTFDSLGYTLSSYYGEQRFAEVFASAKRAPESLAPRIAAIPGVARMETRVVAGVTLDMPGMDEPAGGRGSTTSSSAAAGGSPPAVPTRWWSAIRSPWRTAWSRGRA
jgi:putative ABC transport system permease protein